MRRIERPWLALVLVLTALASTRCDGESSFAIPAWDAGFPSAQFADACSNWAESLCSYEDRCGTSIFARLEHGQCVARNVLTCELVASDPNASFDPDAVSSCLYPSDCSAPDPAVGRICLLAGKAPVGATCVRSIDCQTLYCERSFDEATGVSSTCGVCAKLCDPPCQGTNSCLLHSDGGLTCEQVPTIGQACSYPLALCSNGYCRGVTAQSPGVCTAWARFGEACGDGTTAPLCGDADSYCDQTSQRCQSFQPASYGASCESTTTALYECSGYGSCDTAQTGTCIPPAPDGALCDVNQGLRCLPPATCIANHCLLPSLADCSL